MGINSVYDGGKEENYNMNIMPVSELDVYKRQIGTVTERKVDDAVFSPI